MLARLKDDYASPGRPEMGAATVVEVVFSPSSNERPMPPSRPAPQVDTVMRTPVTPSESPAPRTDQAPVPTQPPIVRALETDESEPLASKSADNEVGHALAAWEEKLRKAEEHLEHRQHRLDLLEAQQEEVYIRRFQALAQREKRVLELEATLELKLSELKKRDEQYERMKLPASQRPVAGASRSRAAPPVGTSMTTFGWDDRVAAAKEYIESIKSQVVQ